jgi:hypothetical protein
VLIKNIKRLSTELLPLIDPPPCHGLEAECHGLDGAQNQLLPLIDPPPCHVVEAECHELDDTQNELKALKIIGLQNRTLQEEVLNATLA